mgnify:CR=1 FL=1
MADLSVNTLFSVSFTIRFAVKTAAGQVIILLAPLQFKLPGAIVPLNLGSDWKLKPPEVPISARLAMGPKEEYSSVLSRRIFMDARCRFKKLRHFAEMFFKRNRILSEKTLFWENCTIYGKIRPSIRQKTG